MLKILAILTAKLVIKIGKIVNRGSCLPGDIALKIDKDILKDLKLNGKIIAVTGSSGKGSTSTIIAKVLSNKGYKVIHNYKGANLDSGIATLLLENCSINGKLDADYFVFEVDERYTKYIFNKIEPDFLVVTNITRDQPPSQRNVDVVLNDIKNAIPKKTHVILSSDDPYLRKLLVNKENKVSYYSVLENIMSKKDSNCCSLNISYCPLCNSKLKYEYYNFEHLGKYKCLNCEFSYQDAICNVTDINFEENYIKIDDKYKIHLVSRLLFNVYNNVAAFTTLMLQGMDKEEISSNMSKLLQNEKIYSQYKYESRNVYTLNNKNENSTTFNQSLYFLDSYNGKKTVVIGWKEISRRYSFNDISWLYDIDFEILNESDIDKVVCVGIQGYDIATRIKYSGVSKANIVVFDNLDDTTKYIKKETKGDIFAILNFDYVEPFNEKMKKQEG